KMADLVCAGQPPHCTKKPDAASNVTVLESEVGANQPFQLGVSGNYLAAASDRETLLRAAPYVTRTLPSRPLAREAVVVTLPHAALAGSVGTHIKQLWTSFRQEREADDVAMRTKHGGSAPDFGDPAEALADMDSKVESFVAILGDLAEARASLSLEPSGTARV